MPQKPRHRKTEMQLWVLDNRKRLNEDPADLARLVGVTTDTARGWESRGNPGEDAIRVLERHFGVPAPRESPGTSDGPGLSYLVAAIDRQSVAISSLAAQVELERAERLRWERGWILTLRAALEGQVPGELLDALVPPPPGDVQR